MKRINRFVIIQVLIFFASSPAIAQKDSNVPSKKWVSVNGYWVIEIPDWKIMSLRSD